MAVDWLTPRGTSAGTQRTDGRQAQHFVLRTLAFASSRCSVCACLLGSCDRCGCCSALWVRRSSNARACACALVLRTRRGACASVHRLARTSWSVFAFLLHSYELGTRLCWAHGCWMGLQSIRFVRLCRRASNNTAISQHRGGGEEAFLHQLTTTLTWHGGAHRRQPRTAMCVRIVWLYSTHPHHFWASAVL